MQHITTVSREFNKSQYDLEVIKMSDKKVMSMKTIFRKEWYNECYC